MVFLNMFVYPLNRVKNHLAQSKKPNTVKKYMTALVKFSSYLQANPLVAKELRITQTNINAVRNHAKNLRSGLSTAILQSRVETKQTHTGK